MSELPLRKIVEEKLVLDVFCSADLDPTHHSLTIGGIRMLCSSYAPTPGLVGAVMFLPDDKFPDFATPVLVNWVASNPRAAGFEWFARKLCGVVLGVAGLTRVASGGGLRRHS
ncbi:hypothetical protein Droror1_Dr00012061 [Drosera rotundifolia]